MSITMRKIFISILFISFLLIPMIIHAELTGEEYKLLWSDVKNFNIDNQKYSLLAGSGIALGAFIIDQDVKNKSYSWKGGINEVVADFGNTIGNPIVDFSLAAIFYASAKKNSTFEAASLTAMESVFLSTAITETIAYSLGRKRPDQNTTSTSFEPFSGSSSFPSGHSTAAMAFFSSYAMYYGAPYSYLFYSMFAATAFGRIYEHKHYLSDTIMGGTIGYVTTAYLYERHKELKNNTYVPLMFTDGKRLFFGFQRKFEI